MKFQVTIEMSSLEGFLWLAGRLAGTGLAGTEIKVNGPVAIATQDEPIATPVNPAPTQEQIRADLNRGAEEARARSEAAAAGKPAPKAPRKRKEPEAKAEGEGAAPASDPGVALQMLKDRITTAARQAMKGEGDKAILNLLPAFRDATGLDFVMNATEAHIPALIELATAAKVPLA